MPTPYGHNVILVGGPMQAGFVGGGDANVSPATSHSIGHAVAVIVYGGKPESKIGDGSWPFVGGTLLNTRVFGSIANCQGTVASNSRSTAIGSSAF